MARRYLETLYRIDGEVWICASHSSTRLVVKVNDDKTASRERHQFPSAITRTSE